MTEQYIIVYEWLLEHPELNRLEALLICEVMRWPKGCYKSSSQLGKLLKADARTIQRKILSLQKREWLAVCHIRKQFRVIFATPKEPPPGPLFEYRQKTVKTMIAYVGKKV